MIGLNKEELIEWFLDARTEFVNPARDKLARFAKSGIGRAASFAGASAISFFTMLHGNDTAKAKTFDNGVAAVTEAAKEYPTAQLPGMIIPFDKSHFGGFTTKDYMTLKVFPQATGEANVVGFVTNDKGDITAIFPVFTPWKSDTGSISPREPSPPHSVVRGDSKLTTSNLIL